MTLAGIWLCFKGTVSFLGRSCLEWTILFRIQWWTGQEGLVRAGLSAPYTGISDNVDRIPPLASGISGSRKFYYTNPLSIVSDAVQLTSWILGRSESLLGLFRKIVHNYKCKLDIKLNINLEKRNHNKSYIQKSSHTANLTNPEKKKEKKKKARTASGSKHCTTFFLFCHPQTFGAGCCGTNSYHNIMSQHWKIWHCGWLDHLWTHLLLWHDKRSLNYPQKPLNTVS